MGKFAWFILGLVLGAAIALAAVTLTGRHRSDEPTDEAPPVITTLPQSPVPGSADPLAPAPPPPAVRKPEISAPPSVEDEAQMAEDAAAAGMTSRSRPRAEPESAPAEAPAASDQ